MAPPTDTPAASQPSSSSKPAASTIKSNPTKEVSAPARIAPSIAPAPGPSSSRPSITGPTKAVPSSNNGSHTNATLPRLSNTSSVPSPNRSAIMNAESNAKKGAPSASTSQPSAPTNAPTSRSTSIPSNSSSPRITQSSIGEQQSRGMSPSPSNTSLSKTQDGQQSNSVNPRIKKTLADHLASQQGVTPPRKRKRVHYSCAECHRRKHRCDRNIPCQPCLDRGLGDSCRPFQDGDEFGDERDRLKRLEDLVEGLARAHATLSEEFDLYKEGKLSTIKNPMNGALKVLGEAAASAAAAHAASPSESGDRGNHKANPRPDKRVRLARMGEVEMEREELRAGSALNDETGQAGLYGGSAGEVLPETNSLEGGLTREGDSFYGALALPSVSRGVIETQIHGERLELSSNVPLRSASAKVHRLIQEGGAPPNVIDELMSCLPPRHESDAMLEWYFRDINDTRLPLHERTFRASYEEIMNWRWGNLRNEEGDDGARHIPFLAFLFVILAIAKRSEPEDRCASDEDARRGALFYLHCARRSMAIASAVRADHIDVLLAALYGARLLITLRQSAESWSLLGVAIRAAQAIGLHRDGTKLGLDAVTTERRRRLWAMIYYLDRTTSMLLGRPQAIDDKTADTLPPSDVDIDVLPRFGPAPTPQPFPPVSTPPTEDGSRRHPGVFCFVAIRHELARLIGRIVEHFQDLSKPRNYADVLQLDADLQHFYASLPGFYLYPALRGEEADRSFDDVCPWLPIHRYLINIEYHYVRNALHRPYLLRSERYKQSREAAFASAKADRVIRKEYEREVSWPSNRARNSHLGGVYRKFASTLIAGIELLLDPSSPNAAELHAVLDDFLSHSTKFADPSQCTKRELAIIKIFKAKAMDPSWCAANSSTLKNGASATAASSPADRQSGAATTPGGTNAKVDIGKGNDAVRATAIAQKARAGAIGGNGNAPTRLPPTQKETNELAQTLLDRLGGIESLQVLNQNQSPSSNSASSVDLSAGLRPAHNGPLSSQAGPIQAGTGVSGAPNQAMTTSNPITSMTTMQNGIVGEPMTAYSVPTSFEGLFDTSDGTDWFGSLDAGAMGGFGGAAMPNNMSFPGMNGSNAQTPGAGAVAGNNEGESDFGGWGTLVEAIVSGQENP
ncbi:uncharacterized protein FA14DRAFT_161772 [Meira miltonrushii]|uniref:Zn(2)-C6 fungal-type domain-containing protein n=1 Tax=Meira miltonrushii TaxID=1280837 RepID=A0A316VA54_9BASI|nr:uncharacterized protein FA14DRAFT_161772 [Meira miltonrushii]PWN34350.1 hypothetical protein FA14DRAFT_161772 [Meira miltonrushii]